mmetsp:Transcript_17272/g.27580  ORF Transcript_17272/g.27580 Transcript_17272/m.27580 type:complete len:340 (-) Transcript_17272:146-1165(-)
MDIFAVISSLGLIAMYKCRLHPAVKGREPSKQKDLIMVSRNLFCAGVSASFASGITAPLDVIRIRRQLLSSSYVPTSVYSFCYYQSPNAVLPRKAAANGIDILKSTAKYEGVGGFWTGYSSEVMRQWTYGVTRVGLHRIFTRKISDAKNGEALSFQELIACATAAGVLAVPLQIPFDKIKIRQIKDMWYGISRYRHVFHGLSSLLCCPKFASDFKKVFPAAMARTVVNNITGVASFDFLQQRAGSHLDVNATMKTVMFSALSSCCVTLFMAPFDSVRNRIIASPNKYTGLAMAFLKIARDEGLFGLYRGASVTAGANWLHNFIILNMFEMAGSFWDRFF